MGTFDSVQEFLKALTHSAEVAARQAVRGEHPNRDEVFQRVLAATIHAFLGRYLHNEEVVTALQASNTAYLQRARDAEAANKALAGLRRLGDDVRLEKGEEVRDLKGQLAERAHVIAKLEGEVSNLTLTLAVRDQKVSELQEKVAERDHVLETVRSHARVVVKRVEEVLPAK